MTQQLICVPCNPAPLATALEAARARTWGDDPLPFEFLQRIRRAHYTAHVRVDGAHWACQTCGTVRTWGDPVV